MKAILGFVIISEIEKPNSLYFQFINLNFNIKKSISGR